MPRPASASRSPLPRSTAAPTASLRHLKKGGVDAVKIADGNGILFQAKRRKILAEATGMRLGSLKRRPYDPSIPQRPSREQKDTCDPPLLCNAYPSFRDATEYTCKS